MKERLISEVLKEVRLIKKSIGENKIRVAKTLRPDPLHLDLERTLISQNLGLADWYQRVRVSPAQKLNIYIDNSSSISFSRRLDLARSIAIVLMSYKTFPDLKIYFFAESVKELSWNKTNVEDFLKKYLSMKSSGYTDLTKALNHLQGLYREGNKARTLFISDGVSSVGSKELSLKLPPGKIHYLKLSGKNTTPSEDLMRIIHHYKGKTVIIKPNLSLVKPLYQIIKRL